VSPPKKKVGDGTCLAMCNFLPRFSFIIIHHIGPDGFGFSLCLKLYSVDIHQVANLQNFLGFWADFNCLIALTQIINKPWQFIIQYNTWVEKHINERDSRLTECRGKIEVFWGRHTLSKLKLYKSKSKLLLMSNKSISQNNNKQSQIRGVNCNNLHGATFNAHRLKIY